MKTGFSDRSAGGIFLDIRSLYGRSRLLAGDSDGGAAPGFTRAAGALACIFLSVAGTSAYAQVAGVDAGSLQRQSDVLAPPAPQPRPQDAGTVVLPGVSVDAIADVPDDPDAPTLYLSEWQFTGNRLFGTPELRGVLADVTGRRLSFAQVSRAARLIEAYYAENGYVARVAVPQQEVVGGKVLLEVQEATYAGVRFEGTPPTRVKPQIIEKVFNGNVRPGTPLRPEALDRPLLIANGYYGVSVSGALAPGQRPGETVLLLNGVDERGHSTELSVDNFGSRSIGAARGSAQFGLYSPLRRGDLLLARLTATESSPEAQLRYSIPVGVRGANVWADLGYLHYNVTQSDLDELDPKGRSLTRSIGATIPLILTRQRDLSLTVSYGRDDLKNDIRGDTVSDYHITRASIGLNGRWYDELGGGGMTRAGLSYTNGSAKGSDAGQHFDDNFDVWRLNLGREQYLTDSTTLLVSLSAQNGPRGLDSAEEFFLGGPYGVRAYPIGEGDGPSGAVLNLELRHRLNDNWAVSGFYDHGWISDRSTPDEPDSYQLKGLGATVSWATPSGWAADMTVARRLGHNPNARENGDDQDGSLHKFRAWFELRRTF